MIWHRIEGFEDEIYLYDGTGITPITNNTYDASYPQINDSGFVVWQGAYGPDQEIFLAVPSDWGALSLLFGGGGGGGGGCFIATAAYGSHMEEEVRLLERVRDEYLLTNELGRFFVSAYYKYSPPLSDFVAKHPAAREIVRIGLYPVLEVSKWFVRQKPSE